MYLSAATYVSGIEITNNSLLLSRMNTYLTNIVYKTRE